MELLDSNGGWPILIDNKTGTNLNNFTWQKIDNTYDQMIGGSTFFQISYKSTREDSGRNSLSVSFYTHTSQIYDSHILQLFSKKSFYIQHAKYLFLLCFNVFYFIYIKVINLCLISLINST